MPGYFSRHLSIQRVIAVGFIAAMFTMFAIYGANREWNSQVGQPGPDVGGACFPAPTCPAGIEECSGGYIVYHSYTIDPNTCQCVEVTMPSGIPCSGGPSGGPGGGPGGGNGGVNAGNNGVNGGNGGVGGIGGSSSASSAVQCQGIRPACFIFPPECCSDGTWGCPDGETGESTCGTSSQPSASSRASQVSSRGSSESSTANVQCNTDADCPASPCNNKCEVVPGFGCAEKCDAVTCQNHQCIGGHKLCDASRCPSCNAGFDCRGQTLNCPQVKPTKCDDGSQPEWQTPSLLCTAGAANCGGRCGKCPTSSKNSSASSSSRSSNNSSGDSSANTSGQSSIRSSVRSSNTSSVRSSRASSRISQLSCTATIGIAYGAIDTALSEDGLPVISVLDSGRASVIKCGNASCTGNNTTSVIFQPPSFDSNWTVTPDISIAVPDDGLPVVAFYTALQGNLRVVKCGNAACSSGNTTTIVDGGVMGYAGKGPSVAIGTDGLPVVSYAAAPGQYGFMSVKFLKCGNAACSQNNAFATVSTGNPYVLSTAVVTPSDGKPFVAFLQQSYIKGVKCGNAACSTGNVADGLGYAPDHAGVVSMHLGADDLPVQSFYQGANFIPPEGAPEFGAVAQKCHDPACSDRTATVLEQPTAVVFSPSIWVGPDGNPAVSFSQWDPNERPLPVTTAFLRLARCGNADCTFGNAVKIVDGSPGAAIITSIVVPDDNLPFIAYADSMGRLKVGKCTNVACDFICTSISRSSSRRSVTSSSSRSSSSSLRSGSPGSSQSSRTVCDDNLDCPSGQLCINGTCEPSSSSRSSRASSQSSAITCDDNRDCPSGQPCVNGTCDPSSSSRSSRASSQSSAITCDDNRDCPSGQPCVNGTCDPSSGSSRSSRSETACRGDECARGGQVFCAGQGGICRLEGDLPCISCIPLSSSSRVTSGGSQSSVVVCDDTLDCPQGLSCTNGTCQPSSSSSSSAACNSDVQCPSGVCSNGSCTTCADDNECASGLCLNSMCSFCLDNSQCPTGLCMNGQCVACSFDAQCPSGLCENNRCIACVENRQCQGNLCMNGTCAACTSGNQCPSGICRNGACDECVNDTQCLAGRRCVGYACLDREEIALLPSYCGNAKLDQGEACDDASHNSNAPNALCRPDCTLGRCGDGILDTPLEFCDDGNMFAGDGCSPQCQVERTAAVQTGILPAQVIELPFQPGGQVSYIPGVGYVPPSTLAPGAPQPPTTTDTGPAAIAIMAAGASVGYAWMKRRRIGKK